MFTEKDLESVFQSLIEESDKAFTNRKEKVLFLGKAWIDWLISKDAIVLKSEEMYLTDAMAAFLNQHSVKVIPVSEEVGYRAMITIKENMCDKEKQARDFWYGEDPGKPVKGFFKSIMDRVKESGNDPFSIKGLPAR